MASDIARLASVAERALARLERQDRAHVQQQLAKRWGHPAPPKVTFGLFLRTIPGLAERFDRTVPPEFVAQTADGELTIACPCGEAPIARVERLAKCDCGRWFLNDGAKIWVAESPAPS